MPKISVHIVESPSPADFLEKRHEGETLAAVLRHAEVPVTVHTIVNEEMLFEFAKKLLGLLRRDITDELLPVLHFSMHGNETGVALTSDERFTWEDLALLVDVFNQAADAQLLVVMSTCNGYQGVTMAERETEPPFFAFVGPKESVPWKDTVGAFTGFYHHLQAPKGSIRRAVEVANQIVHRDLLVAARGDEIQEEARQREIILQEYFARIQQAAPKDGPWAQLLEASGSLGTKREKADLP